jgi:MioC protein
MPIPIIFGTETGNAEMAADDIAAELEANGHEAVSVSMEDFDASSLAGEDFVVVVTSTYGEGELPATTKPFHDALSEGHPDLAGLRFAGFGLGDSSYDTYNNAIETLTATLADLGAAQVGDLGRHDADGGLALSDIASGWAKELADRI